MININVFVVRCEVSSVHGYVDIRNEKVFDGYDKAFEYLTGVVGCKVSVDGYEPFASDSLSFYVERYDGFDEDYFIDEIILE